MFSFNVISFGCIGLSKTHTPTREKERLILGPKKVPIKVHQIEKALECLAAKKKLKSWNFRAMIKNGLFYHFRA